MPEIIFLIHRYWPVAAIGLLTVLLGVQTARIASLKTSHAVYVAKAQKERADAVAAVLARDRASAAISEQEAQRHEKTITDLRAAAAERLQSYTRKAGPVPVVPPAAFVANACPGDPAFLRIPAGQAVALMLAADENTQQLVDLQSWIRKQQESWK